MVLPRWATNEHPIGRHESSMWRKFLRRWWWLGALPVAFSLLTGLCGIVGNLPVFLQAGLSSNSTEILLIFGFIFLQTIVQSLWNLNATAQWVIGVAVGFGSAVTIARERETKNLELLRLTPFPITEIALAKVFAIARQFIWPTVITTAINLLGVFGLAGIAVVSVVVLGGLSGGMLGADIQLAIGAVVVGFLPLITLFLVINTVLDLAYNIAIGLMASCWASTRANAIAYSLVLHFVINMFVLTPLIFLIIIGFSLIGGLLTVITFSPLFIIAALILGAGGAYIVFRAGMVALAGLAAHYQLQRLSE